MELFDAHLHFLGSVKVDELGPRWQTLIAKGLKGFAAIIKGNPPRDREKYLMLVPSAYRHLFQPDFAGEDLDFQLSILKKLAEVSIFPYVDCRFIDEEHSDLSVYLEAGFRGLKVLFIPEEDRDLGLAGWEKFFGRSRIQSEKIVAKMVEQAVGFGWPIIFHAHLKEYGEFTKDILQTFRSHPFIIPHFGFSRKIIAQFMEQFTWCYSDFSSLLPYMQSDPEGYCQFITEFQDRILFGTDTTLGAPGLINDYWEFIVSLLSDTDVMRKILSANYLRIHS